MRCPNCNKFVGMENGEPNVTLEVDYQRDGVFHVTAEFEHYRTCADCSTELKSINETAEADISLDSIEAFAALPEKEKKGILKKLKDGDLQIEIDGDSDTEAEESGGGRYAKNMITLRCNYNITVSDSDAKLLDYSDSIECQNPASAYEECC